MKNNPRFVWLVGDIREQYPDCPESADDGSLVLWDRQEKRAAVTVAKEYGQAMCLELTQPKAAPFSNMEDWFNTTDNESWESESMTPTAAEFLTNEMP